jgi:hypothetical protein
VRSELTRARIAVATFIACLTVAAPAMAGDPIMPLADVRSGMQCTGWSVIQGTEPASFGVEVLDVVDGEPSLEGPRILVRVFGPAVDETGVGPGFSGSPIYCADAAGVQRSIGAISESVGEYGGKVALAMPIEAIIGTPLTPPSRRPKPAPARAKALAAPLSVSGVGGPLARILAAAGRKAGRPILATPSGPYGSYPVQTLRPGSSMAVGLSVGDLTVGALGTVAYVDGDRVWGFGHEFDNAGGRNLFLQDAYVFRVISNPNQLADLGGTYKLGVGGHPIGALLNDTRRAVVGRTGVLPANIPVRIYGHDEDTGKATEMLVRVADETGVDNPVDGSPLQFVAPLALTQAVSGLLGADPGKLTGRMCLRMVLREVRKPIRVCNRYVSAGGAGGQLGFGNIVASQAATDMADAVAAVDAFQFRALHVRELTARVRVSRGAKLAYLRKVHLPRTVRAGRLVRARLVLQRIRGDKFVRRVRLRVPDALSPGRRRLVFAGHGPDSGDAGLIDIFGGSLSFAGGGGGDPTGDPGPENVRSVTAKIRRIARYDGLTVRPPGPRDRKGDRVYRDPEFRIAGRAIARVRVLG